MWLCKTSQNICRKICRSTRPRLSGTMTRTIAQIHSIKSWMMTHLSTTLGRLMQAGSGVSSTMTLFCILTLVQILMISWAVYTVFNRIMKSWPGTKTWSGITNDTFSNNTIECLRQFYQAGCQNIGSWSWTPLTHFATMVWSASIVRPVTLRQWSRWNYVIFRLRHPSYHRKKKQIQIFKPMVTNRVNQTKTLLFLTLLTSPSALWWRSLIERFLLGKE